MAQAAKRTARTQPTIVLYVAGDVPSSLAARRNLQAVLDGTGDLRRFSVAIVDVLLEPQEALQAGLIATPSLVLKVDGRSQWFLGDLRHLDSLRGWIDKLPA